MSQRSQRETSHRVRLIKRSSHFDFLPNDDDDDDDDDGVAFEVWRLSLRAALNSTHQT